MRSMRGSELLYHACVRDLRERFYRYKGILREIDGMEFQLLISVYSAVFDSSAPSNTKIRIGLRERIAASFQYMFLRGTDGTAPV
eukprot:IDg13673t1